MRIAILVHGFPPHAQGGSEIYAAHHAHALAGRGHDVLVIAREADAGRPQRALREEQRDGLRIVWVNNTFADTRDVEDSWAHARLADAVLPAIDAFAPDVVHAHHLTCLATRLVFDLEARAIPVVYTLHDYWLQCHRGQRLNRRLEVCKGPSDRGCGQCIDQAQSSLVAAAKVSGLSHAAARVLPARAVEVLASAVRSLDSRPVDTPFEERRLAHMRDVCARISHFLAPSSSMREAFIAFGVPQDRITLSPYGFDHALLARTPRAAQHPPSRPIRLGFIGTLMVSKAPHLLLEAHAAMPAGATEAHLFGRPAAYHGDHSYAARLAPLLGGPDVHVHGSQPHESIPGVLAGLDVLVVPSIWPENSPLVIQEALVAGVPVIASRTGGIPELVRDGVNGWLFEPGDAAALTSILARLADDPSMLLRLDTSAVAVRSLDDDVRAALDLYRRLAGRPH